MSKWIEYFIYLINLHIYFYFSRTHYNTSLLFDCGLYPVAMIQNHFTYHADARR